MSSEHTLRIYPPQDGPAVSIWYAVVAKALDGCARCRNCCEPVGELVLTRRTTNRSSTSIANHYFSWQSTSTLLVTPLVTTIGSVARQTPVPPSYCGLSAETV
jgi:hypothetical protein